MAVMLPTNTGVGVGTGVLVGSRVAGGSVGVGVAGSDIGVADGASGVGGVASCANEACAVITMHTARSAKHTDLSKRVRCGMLVFV